MRSIASHTIPSRKLGHSFLLLPPLDLLQFFLLVIITVHIPNHEPHDGEDESKEQLEEKGDLCHVHVVCVAVTDCTIIAVAIVIGGFWFDCFLIMSPFVPFDYGGLIM